MALSRTSELPGERSTNSEHESMAVAERCRRQYSALTALTVSNAFPCESLDQALRQTTEVVAKALVVARVSVWRLSPSRELIRCLDRFEFDTNRHSSGEELRSEAYPGYLEKLAESGVVVADTLCGRTSTMDVPLYLNGLVEGIISCERAGASYLWAEDEKTFARAVANFVSLAWDQCERRQAEIALRIAKRQFSDLVNSVEGIVWEADATTFQFTFVSRPAEQLLGYPVDRWLREPTFWRDHLFPPDRDSAVAYCLEATRAMRNHQFEYRMVAADGRLVWLRDIVTVLVEEDRPVKLRGIMVDVTERVTLEAKLRQAQKLESIGLLAGGVAHDFNNILTVISGHTDWLSSLKDMPAEADESLQEIAAAGDRAANLTRQLLAFSRKQVMQQQDLDLNEVVGRIAKMLQRLIGEHIQLEVQCMANLPLISADAGMMEQVLMNLAVNARDAMPQGGKLVISTNVRIIDDAYVQHHPEAVSGCYVHLSFTDTGCGISPENLSRIFEPFFTTKEVGCGTGLGLATVHGIIKQHRGWVELHSEVGRGTVFEIFLPVVATITAKSTTPKPPEVRGGTETILIVEDEAAVRELVQSILEQLGYTVLEAPTGPEALRIWQQSKDQIHLLLTDLVLPGGMNGLEVAAQMQSDRGSLKVIYTSGYSVSVVDGSLMGHEEVSFLKKPYRLAELAQIVRQRLDA